MLKHVGRMANNKRKIVVAYRTVPGEPENAIVVTTENLMSEEHDTLMKLVESSAGQESDELATAMARTPLPDGRNMLAAFHTTGKMVKVPTADVEMVPNRNTVIRLNELNEAIAQQKGITVADLSMHGKQTPSEAPITAEEVAEAAPVPMDNGVLTDEELAAQYRSQADALFKEAKALREQAEELVPTKKKAKAKTEESA
jgi:hypothetical protein